MTVAGVHDTLVEVGGSVALSVSVVEPVGDLGVRVKLEVPRLAVRPGDWTVESVTGVVPVKLLSGPPERETETATLVLNGTVVLTAVEDTASWKLP